MILFATGVKQGFESFIHHFREAIGRYGEVCVNEGSRPPVASQPLLQPIEIVLGNGFSSTVSKPHKD